MPWPAWYRPEGEAPGTCYIPLGDFPRVFDAHERRGQAWRYGAHGKWKWSTYCPNRQTTYKSLERLAPESRADFWEIIEQAKKIGLKNPPTSLSDLFMSCVSIPMPQITPRAPFYGLRFGGWQEAFRHGAMNGKVYQYDLNKAYRWAACQGLPDLRSAHPTMDFHRPYAIYLCAGIRTGTIPYRRVPSNLSHVVTSEERDALGITRESVQVIRGLEFSKTVDLSKTFIMIDETFSPSIISRLCHSFWGFWNTTMGPDQVSWGHGEKSRTMKNPWHNPIWSAFITSRVKLRLNLWRKYALHCHTDSIHTYQELPTGEAVGDWKLVDVYENFVINAQGSWDGMGRAGRVTKHAGRGGVRAPRGGIMLTPDSPEKRRLAFIAGMR